MTENTDKYRALHDFITDPSKAELFGTGGLFGGLKGDHTVLKLFATFVNELKREYGYVPETIDSETFIEYIESDPSLTEEKKKAIVEKIEYLTKKGIIQGQPVYTLYNFAVVLDDLEIGEKKELITIEYDRALTNQPAAGSVSQSNLVPATSVSGAASGVVSSVPQSNPVPGNGQEKQETDQTDDEEDKELSVSEEDREEESLEAEEGIKPVNQKEQQSIGPALGGGSPVNNGLSKPNLFLESDNKNPQGQEQNAEIPHEKETIGTEKSKTEKFETPGLKSLIVPGQSQSQLQNQMQATTPEATRLGGGAAGATPRRVVSTGKGLRKPTFQPERLRELTPKEAQKTKDKTQQEQQGQQQAGQSEVNPQRSANEGGSTLKDTGKKPSFAKKLAKLAGAGVGAGVILPLFAGGSAKAADFSFIQKIISLLF